MQLPSFLPQTKRELYNTFHFHSKHLPFQVDSVEMYPLIRNQLEDISYFHRRDPKNPSHLPSDLIEVTTRNRSRMLIRFFSRHVKQYSLSACVHSGRTAKTYGAGSVMILRSSHLDEELTNALDRIVQDADIDIITADAEVLSQKNNRYLLEGLSRYDVYVP